MDSIKRRIEALEYLVEELIYKLGKSNQRMNSLNHQLIYLKKQHCEKSLNQEASTLVKH